MQFLLQPISWSIKVILLIILIWNAYQQILLMAHVNV